MRVSVTLLLGLLLTLSGVSVVAEMRSADVPSSAFASLEGFTGARLSPDGERLAYLYPLENRWHLVVHTFETGKNILVPPVEKLDFKWLHWANDRHIVFSMSYSATRVTWRTTETIETRLISVDIETGNTTALIKPAVKVGRTGSRTAREYYAEAQVQDEVVDWLIDEPNYILVALDEDFDGGDEIRKIDITSGDYEIVHESTQGIQRWLVDRRGIVRFGYGRDPRTSSWRTVLKTADGEWLPVRKMNWFQEGWFPHDFSSDPSAIYVNGFGEHGTREYRLLQLDEGRFIKTVFADERYDSASLMRHPIDESPVGVLVTRHRDEIHYFDPEFDRLQQSIDAILTDTVNRISSMTRDGQKILVEASSDREPGILLIWDRDAGTIEPFGWFMENIDVALMADVKPVEYESADGTKIPGYLTLPGDADLRALPFVVMPHGGPASRDSEKFWFLSQFLASRGYGVLQPNFRGSTGYGHAFREAGKGQWGGLMQDDVDVGARWLADEGLADPERICIVGWSYGGYSAVMGLIKSPELYRCGVSINGVYNLPRLIADSKEYIGGTRWSRHIGLEGESSKSVSPYHQAEGIQAPLLLIHAEDDARVRSYQAQDMHERLGKLGKPAELVMLDHGGHSLVDASARERALDKIERFLEDRIGGR